MNILSLFNIIHISWKMRFSLLLTVILVQSTICLGTEEKCEEKCKTTCEEDCPEKRVCTADEKDCGTLKIVPTPPEYCDPVKICVDKHCECKYIVPYLLVKNPVSGINLNTKINLTYSNAPHF